MKINFYTNLAKKNIKSNAQTYGAFIFATTLSFMMYCILSGLRNVYGQGSTTSMFLGIGGEFIAYFSIIFIYYGNKFLIKRRTKEIGLYSILGLEKKHIAIVLLFEFLFSFIVSVILGSLISLLFGKLVFLILNKMTSIAGCLANRTYSFDFHDFPKACLIFLGIFFVNYLYNLAKISFLNPIQLLKDSKKGEKKNKISIVKTIIGILCLSAGYFMSLYVKTMTQGMVFLLPAIVVVMIGTFFFFNSILNFTLNKMKKRKSYYTQAHKFIFISGMNHRMGQNAKGLANICILLTMIFIAIASTISVYEADMNLINSQYVKNYKLENGNPKLAIKNSEKVINKIKSISKEKNIDTDEFTLIEEIDQVVSLINNKCKKLDRMSWNTNYTLIHMASLQNINKFLKKNISLNENEIIIISDDHNIEYKKAFYIQNLKFTIKVIDKKLIKNIKASPYYEKFMGKTACFIFKNDKELKKVKNNLANEGKHPVVNATVTSQICWNAKSENLSEKEIHDFYKAELSKAFADNESKPEFSSSRQSLIERREFSGAFLFLGVFLSLLFLLWLLLIMYFKQVSESYEERANYQTMKKIGMDSSLIKKTSRLQMFWMFSLPILFAIIHSLFGANIFVKFLEGVAPISSIQFLSSLGVTVLVVSIIYAFFYLITSKRYNKNI